jgi:Tol biopolymer transport system component
VSRPRCRIALLLAAAVIAVGITGCGGGARSRVARAIPTAAYPASFVALSHNTKAPGITVYSSATGRTLRRLTDGSRDIDPILTANHRWVYFVRVPKDFCPVQLWRVGFNGGKATELTTAGYPGGAVSVSPDGTMLAYTANPPGPCKLQDSPTSLVLVNLSTGRTHRVADTIVWGMAWSADDTRLAVVTPSAASGRSQIRLISNPFRATTTGLSATAPLACPTDDACAETSPSFDAQGDLFYTAVISSRTSNYCWLHACVNWTYANLSQRGAQTRTLTSHRVRGSAIVPSSVVNTDGTALLYTLPQGTGTQVWRWTNAHSAAVPMPGAAGVQPVWQ